MSSGRGWAGCRSARGSEGSDGVGGLCETRRGGGVSRWVEGRVVGGGVGVAWLGVGLRRFWVRKTAPWALVRRVVKMSASLVKNWEGVC